MVDQVAKGALIPVATLEVRGIKSFVVMERFCEKKGIDGVLIKWLGPNFKRNFLDKTEVDVAPATLRVHGVKDSPTNALILAELGDLAEMSLAHFWELLKDHFSKAVSGNPINDWCIIAYMRDKENGLWVVRAHWPSGFKGLNIEAYSAKEDANQVRWSDTHQVVSH